MILKFPEGFLWGSAVSAHQTEGNNVNSDWWAWEHSEARIDALKKSGKDPSQYQSGRACDFYNRYEQDFDLVKRLNQNAFRLSIEWARVEPQEGKFDEEAMTHYKKMIAGLRLRSIEPFVTLFHFTLPVWVARKGGFQNRRNIERFARYTSYVARSLPGVKFWITINEPVVYALMAYLWGIFPPQKKNIFAFLTVLDNLVDAHRAAYKAVKKHNPEYQIGVAKNMVFLEAAGGKIYNRILTRFFRWIVNDRFLEHVEDAQDFIGVNYYFHRLVSASGLSESRAKVSDRGWGLSPEGIYEILVDTKKYHKPTYVLEHGLADAEDKNRSWYIRESFKQLHRAISDGVDVRGYFHWSLYDNFEWEDGYEWKFGLAAVDFEILERTPRPSAEVYAEICRTNIVS